MSQALLPVSVLAVALVASVAWEAFAARASSVRRALGAVGMRLLAFGFLAFALVRPVRESEVVLAARRGKGVVIFGTSGGRLPAFVNSPEGRARVDVIRLGNDEPGRGGETLKRALRSLGTGGGAALFVLGAGDDFPCATGIAGGLARRGIVVSAVAPEPSVAPELITSPVSVLPHEPRGRAMAVAVSELSASLSGPARARVTWTLDGRLLGSRLLALGPGTATTRLEQAFVVPADGLHRVRVDVTGVASASTATFFRAGPGVRRVVVIEGGARSAYRALRRAIDDEAAFLVRGSCAADRMRGYSVIPRTEAEWSSVDVVVLGDLAAAELPVGVAERLARFVREGGGLLVLAGDGNMGRGGWQRTALARVLPVSGGGAVRGPFDARPAGRVGLPRPFPFGSMWAGLESPSSVEGAASWQRLPELESAYEARTLVEGASVPVVVARPGRTLPLLVWRKVGRGVCAAVMSDDLWRWRAGGEACRVAHDAFWRDLLVGMARRSEGAGASLWLEADTRKTVAGRPLGASVYVTDSSIAVEVEIRIEREGGAVAAKTCSLPPGSIVRPFSLHPERAGVLTLRATAVRDGRRLASAPFQTLIVAEPAEEPPVESVALEAVCLASGGAFGSPSQPGRAVESFLRSLDRADGREERVPFRSPVVPTGMLVVMAMGLLAAEWGVARMTEDR